MAARVLALDPVEPLEQPGQFLRRDALAGIRHGQFDPIVQRGQPNPDRSLMRELEGVGQQVEHDRLVHAAVDRHGARKGLNVDGEVQPGLLHRGSEVGG